MNKGHASTEYEAYYASLELGGDAGFVNILLHGRPREELDHRAVARTTIEDKI